jgi:hypothetical protein
MSKKKKKFTTWDRWAETPSFSGSDDDSDDSDDLYENEIRKKQRNHNTLERLIENYLFKVSILGDNEGKTARQIWNAISNKYNTTGITPWASVSKILSTDVKKNGQKSKFVRVNSGMYKLRNNH